MSLRTEPRPVSAAPRRRSRVRRLFVLVLVLVTATALLAPVVAAGRVLQAAGHDDRTPTDAVVVLGAAQFWGRPSPVLEARLTHAVDLFDAEVAPRIVTVGGKQDGDITTEAQAGKAFLVDAGLPAKRITAVATGSDTLTSLTAVAELMADRGWTSATIVTDPAHEARSLAMARSLGIDAHGSPTQDGAGSAITFDYVARETAGLLYFWLVERWAIETVVAS